MTAKEQAKQVVYEAVTPEDTDEVAALYGEYLNSGIPMQIHEREALLSPDYLGYKAVWNGTIVGLLSATKGLEFTYPHPELEKRIKDFLEDRPVYTADAIIVRENFRHHEVMKWLSRELIPRLYETGYRYLAVEMWVHPDGETPAAKAAGFWGDKVYEEAIPDFYRDLKKYKMVCPLCGEICRCGARINIFRITEQTLLKL